MEKMPECVLERFLKGVHVTRHVPGVWNAIWSDIIIISGFKPGFQLMMSATSLFIWPSPICPSPLGLPYWLFSDKCHWQAYFVRSSLVFLVVWILPLPSLCISLPNHCHLFGPYGLTIAVSSIDYIPINFINSGLHIFSGRATPYIHQINLIFILSSFRSCSALVTHVWSIDHAASDAYLINMTFHLSCCILECKERGELPELTHALRKC